MSEINSSFKWEEKTWDIIDKYFKQKNVLTKHHLNSYNYFIKHDLPNIVKEKNYNVAIYADWDKEKSIYLKKYYVNFGKVYVSKPVIYENNGTTKPMYPHEARLRNLSYESNIYVDIHHKLETIDPKTMEKNIIEYPPLIKFEVCKLPIMVRSNLCVLSEQSPYTNYMVKEGEFDYGGYFIIKGGEKVVVSLERQLENKVYCFKRSSINTIYSHMSEVSSIDPTNPSNIVSVNVKLSAKGEDIDKVIRVSLRGLKVDIPLFVIFRALNVISDRKITEMIVFDVDSDINKKIIDMLRGSIKEATPIQSQKIALDFISKHIPTIRSKEYQQNNYKIRYAYEKLLDLLFPHLGRSPVKKAYYLGYMVKKLIKTYLGLIKYDDRDSFLNKKVEPIGELMCQLFRAHFSKYVKDMKQALDKEARQGLIDECGINLNKKFRPNEITGSIRNAFGTGSWGEKGQAKKKKGVSQLLDRQSYLSTISQLRRVIAPIDRGGKELAPRKLHSSQYGVICPFETPEGGSVGIVKNMAMTCNITNPSDPKIIYNCLDEYGIQSLENITPKFVGYSVKVFVNGNWYGQTDNPVALFDKLKKMKRRGIINIFTSISWDVHNDEFHIRTDGGRLCRPLYIVKNNNLIINDKIIDNIIKEEKTWDEIVNNNKSYSNCDICREVEKNENDENCIIEYIDVHESNSSMISMTKDNLVNNKKTNDAYYNYGYCEIHPYMMFSVITTIIPFAEHNQAPRVQFCSAQLKANMGVYTTAFRNRMDTSSFILNYPQKPICTTIPSKYINCNELPYGENCIVAIASHTGYNQEDSLMFNKSSIERGLMRANSYRSFQDEEEVGAKGEGNQIFMKPEKNYPDGRCKTEGMSYGSYDKLDENGFVKIGSHVQEDDAIIGKVLELKNIDEDDCEYKDTSLLVPRNEHGIVDDVFVGVNGLGNRVCKVRVKTEKIPEMGDKFAARHGQKGTIGISYNDEDMPFTKDGMVPDIIMNPHAFPKRMTIGQLIESVFSKLSVLMGVELDATPFRRIDINGAGEVLKQLGFRKGGFEVLYNGRTGEQLKADIFIGPVYYSRLKHIVSKKINSRARGPKQLLTKQPTEGRSRGGGMRLGEMERDSLLGNGLSQFIKERTMECSDKFTVWIDKESGMISPVNPEKNIYKSLYSKNTKRFARVNIPYASKLLIHELMSNHIVPKIETTGLL